MERKERPQRNRQRRERRRQELERKLYAKFHLDPAQVAQEQARVGLGPDDTETLKFLESVPNLKFKAQKKEEKEQRKALGKPKEKNKDKKEEKGKSGGAAASVARTPRPSDPYLVLLVGDKGVGKSALLERYLHARFKAAYVPTRFEIHTAQLTYQGPHHLAFAACATLTSLRVQASRALWSCGTRVPTPTTRSGCCCATRRRR